MEEEIPTEILIAGGKKIALYQLGQGFPVILLHGLIAKGAWSLRHLAKRLSEHFQVIGVHLPGYEGSQEVKFRNYQQLTQLIIALVRKLGISKFHLFGHSTGGTIAIVTASEFPEKIGKLALFEPPFAKSNVWLPWRLAAFFTWLPGYVWILRQILSRTGISDFKGGRSGSIGVLIRIGKILSKSDFSPDCQEITNLAIPTFLAFGQKSSLLLSLNSMKEIIKLIPGSQEITLEGADHTLRREFQERLADHLISFFLS